MDFQKNSFYKNSPTKIAGNKVLPQNNPLERTKKFMEQQNRETQPVEPMTPEKRFEEQKNQRHFLNKFNPFRNK